MNNDFICDDREKPIPEEILKMSDEEIEAEFRKRFDKVIMKEQIEKKLGCTIEEHLNKLKAISKKYDGYEIEKPPAFPGLTIEELDYLTEYIKSKM